MRARHFVIPIIALLAVGAAVACSTGGFDPESKVESVRMFGVVADKPYANPGDTVTLTTMVADRRRDQPLPLKVYWIPAVCINPGQDLYYACFFPAGGVPGVDAGATVEAPFPSDAGTDAGTGSLLGRIPTGVDLSSFLPQGNTFQFQLPQKVIEPRTGTSPYGLAIVFNIACAGEVRLAPRSGANPQQVPIECTDQNGKVLGADDYVIGINRVYSYGDRTNTNPVIQGITLNSVPIDMDAGITLDHCVASRRRDCKEWLIDVQVPASSWELNPAQGSVPAEHEQIWVDYFSDQGDFESDARLLYDTQTGRVTASDVKYLAPYAPGEATIWMVVHDNRAGAAFVTIPLHVK